MKKKVFIALILLLGIMSCENQEQIFDDFDYKAVYFPFQTPLRSLSLGEDRVNNTLDKEFKFDIGVTIGGMYEQKWNWTVDYVVDESLTDNAINADGEDILPLPAAYYSLDPSNTITIPAGDNNGRLGVQLTEAFFDDTLALTGRYVVPLLITGTSADTVLSGKPAAENPDRRIASDWEPSLEPKDWVMFGIKYINAYHGNYLQRGRDIRYSGGIPVDTLEYRNANVEFDKLVSLKSVGKVTSETSFLGQNAGGNNTMILTFANMWGTPGGAITISPSPNSTLSVTGTGQYLDKANSGETVIELPMQAMYLNYTWDDGTYVHQVSDTLVFRDRGLKFESNTIIIEEP